VREANEDLNKTDDNAQQQEIATQAESRKMAAVKAESLLESTRTFERKFLSYLNEVNNSPSWAQ
jgi:hypothetical protein